MDRWEASIKEYQRSQTLSTMSSVLHTAEGILKEDLAAFELDWFIQTLLSEPVHLLDTISVRHSDAAWKKIIKEAYKLLSNLVEKHYEGMEQYIGHIVSECRKAERAELRSDALHCLSACVKRAPHWEHAGQYVAELATASTSKAPLALLVGTICEYHPEVVADDFIRIWRTFLNLLESSKNSDMVCKSLLTGVWGLFKNFGTDIPLTEIAQFYEKLTREMFSRCEKAVLRILRDYPSLFREKLASDDRFRRELWACDDLSAILPIYAEVTGALPKEQLLVILRTEVAPRTTGSRKEKFTALRCARLFRERGVDVGGVSDLNVYSLEFQLRSQIGYDTAEAVHWCIESNATNSDKLLQTAILFHKNLPAGKTEGIVVEGLLNAPDDVMNVTLNFLTTQTCRDECSLLDYLPLWRDIFASQLTRQRNLLFEKYIENFLLVVDNFLEEEGDDKKIPDKISVLLTLTSHILTLQPADDTTGQCALIPSKLVELARACGLEAPVVAVARAMLPHLEEGEGVKEIIEMIQIDKCKDESLLCESCLILIEEAEMAGPDVTLKALEVIFSRKDAEPRTLSLAIKKLEQLINSANNNLDKQSVSKIMQLLHKLRSRKDMSGKFARILQRDVAVFLGKYWGTDDFSIPTNSEENSLIVRLKDALTLDVPNPVHGTVYKIRLNRLLHLAIVHEDEGSLRMLINVICANLCANSSPLLQGALGRAVVSLCRATVGVARQNVARHAAAFCDADATLYILQQINGEKSPAVRRMLSEAVEFILLKDPGTGSNEALLKAVYEKGCAMMDSGNSMIKLGGLDITDTLISALKVNRHQTKEMLPNLMLLISKTREENSLRIFEKATALFLENIGLFEDTVDSTVTELFRTMLDFENRDVEAKIYNATVKSALGFSRQACGAKHEFVVGQLFGLKVDSVEFVYVLAEFAECFALEEDVLNEILCMENGRVWERVFNETALSDAFVMEAHLRFLNRFAAAFLKGSSEQTLKHISCIIDSLQPKHVTTHHKQLSELLAHVRRILRSTPDILLRSFIKWSNRIPVEDVTTHLEKEKFIPEHAVHVNSLRLMLEIFELKDPAVVLTTVTASARTWARTILKIFAGGRLKYLKGEMPYLSDLMSLSLQLSKSNVRQILLEGRGLPGANENVGIELCRVFMPVFVRYLVEKPLVLLQDGMQHCWELLNDVVKYAVRRKWRGAEMESVLGLVEELWPTYLAKASFKSKQSLLLDLSCAKVGYDCVAMRHAVAAVCDAARDERVALVALLPGGEECREAYQRFASDLLQTRLSDVDGASSAALRGLLDALAGTADETLLEVVTALADGDETPGWWDDALTSCMASLATSPSLTTSLLTSLHRRAGRSPGVCRRIFLPLVRFSPTTVCKPFFAAILKETLGILCSNVKAPSIHAAYAACVRHRTIALETLQVVFERVAPSDIESPSSFLYAEVPTDKPWHLAREVITNCNRLRSKILTPEGASEELASICRDFQYAAYKCMCVCLCVRRPDARMYEVVLRAPVWRALVPESVHYELPLETEWVQKQRSVAALAATPAGGVRARRGSQARVFLRTLSENPLDFDLIEAEELVETQDVLLPASSLSGHPVSGTATALLAHLSAVSGREWLAALCRSLEELSSAGRNAAWILAQAVCSNREVLKQHATELRPALLAVLVNTAQGDLNGLHINILNTLTLWQDDIHLSEAAVSHLNASVVKLVDTALNNADRSRIFSMLDHVLENLMRSYGSYVTGHVDMGPRFDDNTKPCLKLLLRFAKNGVRVRDLLAMLLDKLEKNHRVYKAEVAMMAELIGLEMTHCDEPEKSAAASRLKRILEDVKRSSMPNYLQIVHRSGCCDQQQFRAIVDAAQKLPKADTERCLQIISAYITKHPGSREVNDLPPDIRQMTDRMCTDRCLEELLRAESVGENAQPPTKRARIEVTSAILKTVGRTERALAQLAAGGDVGGRLAHDLTSLRFVECFYVAVYLPLRYNSEKPAELSVCLSSFFEMFFRHAKTLDAFRTKRLRDEPWIVEHPIGLSRTSRSRLVGTLRSFSYDASPPLDVAEEAEEGIDVQVCVEKILDTFMEFAKVSTEAGVELLTQLLRCLGRGFDSRPVLARLLSSLVSAAPETAVVARECVDLLCDVEGFPRTVEELKTSSLGSEGEDIFALLHEETAIRQRNPEQFVTGRTLAEDNLSMAEEKKFSIEGLTSAFQKLSNWDDLRFQDRRRIERDLPVLWTEREEFKNLLDGYTDTGSWFGKMAALYRDERKDVMTWLRALDRWPRRRYVISSVMEALQWHTDQRAFDSDKLQMPSTIHRRDCLVEWAARLMLRNVYLTDSSQTEATGKLSRSHELRYCERASEMGLYDVALSVIKRNRFDLHEDEILQWKAQEMLCAARRLEPDNLPALQLAVAACDRLQLQDYYRFSTPDAVIEVNTLMARFHYTLQSLTQPKLESTMLVVEEQLNRLNERGVTSHKSKKNTSELCETAVLYYNGLWDADELSNEEILVKICASLDRLSSWTLDGAGVAAVLLARLDECAALSDAVASTVLTTLKPIITELPACYLDQLKAKRCLFSRSLRSCGIPELQEEPTLDTSKECLQLLCDADYLLLQYCEQLYTSLHGDTSKWDTVFSRMLARVFENAYAGADYQALQRYRAPLDSIRTADENMKGLVLKGIMSELRARPARALVRLSHACTRDVRPALDKLLRAGERAVSVLEEIHVFTDSVRRPCVLTVLTSTGRKRRFLLKNEDLRADAAARCLDSAMYNVFPLSEDCGLIEYLEDHKRVRELIASRCDIDFPKVRQHEKDEELILAPKISSINNFDEICSRIPAHSLRSAIEDHCSSVEDFVSKKRRFTETLSKITITNWLLGLGDRHLQNMMYSIQHGDCVCVDWGAILQYGSELPPARLTRNLLAVCDTKVLESRLQVLLARLRDRHQFVVPTVKLSFSWMEDCAGKLVYIERILRGKTVAHEITKNVIRVSDKAHKEKYIALLDNVFSGHESKDCYSVEEQVASLLLQSTDRLVLSVTRSGWEPWL